MATWTPPSDALLAVGKPGRPSHARAIRDLPTALAEHASGAPWVNGVGAVEHIIGFEFGAAGRPHDERSPIGAWVVPDNVERLDVTVIGGGGYGGIWEVAGGYRRGGGGGGGGAAWREVLVVTPGQVFYVFVGSGGSGSHASDGGQTTFGDTRAAGGSGGGAGTYPLYGVGGAGGAPFTEQISDPRFTPGAAGGDSQNGGHFDSGGKPLISGRGAGSPLGGGGAPGRAVSLGGTGGAGYDAGSVVAGIGYIGIYGAGGSGAAPGSGSGVTAGGRGANGAVIVRY